jgi:hypothetical protein
MVLNQLPILIDSVLTLEAACTDILEAIAGGKAFRQAGCNDNQ